MESKLYTELLQKVNYAKASNSRELLYQAYGSICIARDLEAISHGEYMSLNHECIYDGINNPKYYGSGYITTAAMENSFNMAVAQMVELSKKLLIERMSEYSKLNQCDDHEQQRELEKLYYNEIAATANVIRLFTGREISFQWQNGANGEDYGGFALYEILGDAPFDEAIPGIPCEMVWTHTPQGAKRVAVHTEYNRYSGKCEPSKRINWSKGLKEGKIIKIYQLVYDVNANPVYVGGYTADVTPN